MDSVNELIVELVTASNDVEACDRTRLSQLALSAASHIRRLHDPEHAVGHADVAPSLERVATDAGDTAPELWQETLRNAAETLRALQPMVDPERALPAHRPDGGDGGNY